jgi:hypothetical protein
VFAVWKWIRLTLVLCGILLVAGCSNNPGSTPVDAPDLPQAELIKNDLQMVAESGQLGSEMGSIQQNLEAMKEADPAKAAELLKDLEELQSLSGDAAKSKAKAMIGKL